MSKPTIGITAWLNNFFGGSHKAISEALPTEQYNAFVSEAEKLMQAQGADPEQKKEDGSPEPTNSDATPEPKNTEPTSTDLQARITALETKLGEANTALEGEKKAHSATSAQLTEAKSALTASEDKNKQLRQAVNPVGDEDLVNKETGNSNTGLTKADIEAREEYKRNRTQA
ncbi:hypothetical protein [Dyadobacter sp. OTU695]|uniref:hypothetical protein n=1 Tax=Dyadobacter sp. OTU695 TaxID=3043860 RepID=UPI00313B25A5